MTARRFCVFAVICQGLCERFDVWMTSLRVRFTERKGCWQLAGVGICARCGTSGNEGKENNDALEA